MRESVNARFRSQLPFTVPVLRHKVTFDRSSDSGVKVTVDRPASDKPVRNAIETWDQRKAVHVNGPEERRHWESVTARLLTEDAVRRFLDFLIQQPIGLRLLIVRKGSTISRMKARHLALNDACLTWDARNNWPRGAGGRLPFAIPCAGYLTRISLADTSLEHLSEESAVRCLCFKNVTDPSGFCPSHRGPNCRTLFNWYPFFAHEGVPELDVRAGG